MKIIIPGEPIAQPRLRSFLQSGSIRHYDPAKKQKDIIKFFLRNFLSHNHPSYKFPSNPKLSIFFYCSIPVSMSKKLRKYAELGFLRKSTRPDCDNYLKLYLDCMNEVLFQDDSSVSLGCVDKFYHREPKTVIYLDECSEILYIPDDENQHCLESYEWIHEKMASIRDCLCPGYADAEKSRAS